ncbi:hypothetical protein [Anaerovorax sp. IOR16]|uniref:hypothetical protein n=1 Tax=Anaerovorax sp. IOR16 TaxID=2773458 RepID=UPI0019D0DF64|nr:hypothetical protein [Anaerovorax sp. IOR16]
MPNIKKGDRVIISGSAEEIKYRGCIFEVLTEPYIVSGSELVKMKCHENGKYFGGGYSTEFLLKVPKRYDEQKCRICGCTWYNACPGGCYWVEEDLCSACVDVAKEIE